MLCSLIIIAHPAENVNRFREMSENLPAGPDVSPNISPLPVLWQAGTILSCGQVSRTAERGHRADGGSPVRGSGIVVKKRCASIRGTDVAVDGHGPNTGHRITIGGRFGHEVVSLVVQVGKDMRDIVVGDVV